MTADYEYRVRPGHLGLSIAALAGLTLLASVIWTLAPVFSLVLMLPALAACFYQLVFSPVYGLRLNTDGWQVISEAPDLTIPLSEINHVEFSDRPDRARCTLVLTDGSRVPLPDEAMPHDLLGLAREATHLGLAIRQV